MVAEVAQKYSYERLYSAKAGTLTTPSGDKTFVSFQTIVGFRRAGKVAAFTSFWTKSKATQDHISRWQREPENIASVKLSKEQFERAVGKFFGLDAGFRRAPVWFADRDNNYTVDIRDARWKV